MGVAEFLSNSGMSSQKNTSCPMLCICWICRSWTSKSWSPTASLDSLLFYCTPLCATEHTRESVSSGRHCKVLPGLSNMWRRASLLVIYIPVLNPLPDFTSQNWLIIAKRFRQPCGCLHQWRYKTEGDSLYIGYNAWKKALNVGVSDSRWGDGWWIDLRGLGWWDQVMCRVQKWYLTKKNKELVIYKLGTTCHYFCLRCEGVT